MFASFKLILTFVVSVVISPLKIMNVNKKVAKKAFKEIKEILNATNMVQVEMSISSALQKTFGLQNIGMIAHAMNTENVPLMNRYEYYGSNRNVELTKSIRYFNLDTYGIEAKRYLASLIPERMHKAQMYKNLIEGLKNI